MIKLIVLTALGCLALTACEKRLTGDSPYSRGPTEDRAPPVGTITPASPTLPAPK
jgi:hypothetical protein